jgi:hypothetical protein
MRVELCDEIVRIIPRYAVEKKAYGRMDLDSFGMNIRSSRHQIGSRMLEALVNADGEDYRGRVIPCGQGYQYEFVEYRACA